MLHRIAKTYVSGSALGFPAQAEQLSGTSRIRFDVDGTAAFSKRQFSTPQFPLPWAKRAHYAARMKSSPSTNPRDARNSAIRSPVPRWLMKLITSASPGPGSSSCAMKR